MIQDALFLLGMHRSGTSLLARLIAAEGYDLPGDLFPPHALDNPDGYQESKTVVHINNAFFESVGSHWKDPCPLPPGCFESQAAGVARGEIRRFLSSIAGDRLLLKDPRLCRVLPLWLAELDAAAVRAIHLIRAPGAVQASLKRRSEIEDIRRGGIPDPVHSGLLWWRHVTEATLHCRHVPSLCLAYETLLAEPASVRARLREFLAMPERQPAPPAWATLRAPAPAATDAGAHAGDVEGFLEWSRGRALRGLATLQAPVRDVPAPPLGSAQPWSPEVYARVSAATLKHLSGSIPHVPDRRRSFDRSKDQRDSAAFVFVSEQPHWPCQIYRVKNPVDALRRAGIDSAWYSRRQVLNDPTLLAAARCVVLHRLDWDADFQALVAACRARGIPAGYDLDDLIFLPELVRSGQRDALNRQGEDAVQAWLERAAGYGKCIAESDFFIGATAALVEAAEPFNRRCHEIPNGFSPETLHMSALARASVTRKNDRIVLGYASGTDTHRADFKVAADAIWRLMREDERIRLRIIGPMGFDEPPPQPLEARIERRKLVPHVNLPFELAAFHVNLAPLERNAFCDAKSPLKYFEAALVDVPTVATNNPTYAGLAGDGGGLALASTTDEWFEHLAACAGRLDSIVDRGRLARRASVARFSADRIVKAYLDLPQRC